MPTDQEFSEKNSPINHGALRAIGQMVGRFAQKWSAKSLIEGGTDIGGARAADVRSSFNE